MNRKIVVCRNPNAGFGDHMHCLFGSWWYAKQTNRTLLIDWRGSRFGLGNNRNRFLDMFKPFTQLAGVPVVVNNDIGDFDFGDRYYWPKWTTENLKDIDHVAHTTEEIKTLNQLVDSGEPRDEDAVVFNQRLPFPPRTSGVMEAIETLKFISEVQLAANQYLGGLSFKPSTNKNLIALHLRHGNGENIGDRCVYWLDNTELIRQLFRNKQNDMHAKGLNGRFLDNMPNSLTELKYERNQENKLYKQAAERVVQLRSEIGAKTPVILFTDAAQVVTAINKVIPNVVRYDSGLLDFGAGPLHNFAALSDERSGNIQLERTFDMLCEAQIMLSCNALVSIPSGFPIILKGGLPLNRVHELKPALINSVILKLFKILY
ncbi:MAG: hypothetical protein ACI9FR_003133 [Cryomorphaceae bacterium]|jgi:hypothetical protein